MKVNYLVIYVSNIEESRQFYEILGCECVREQHDAGPIHYSISLDGIVVELYPKGKKEVSRIRLGIHTSKSFSEIGQDLIKFISGSGENTLLASDPDGNTIEIMTKNAIEQ